MVVTSPATATARDLSSSPVAWRTAPLSGRTASDSAVAVARAAAVLLTGRGGAAERGRCGDIFSSVIDPRASLIAGAAISGEVGVLSNVARCSCATTRVATQLLLDDVIVGCTAGTQHANTCTRACAPPLVAARATSMVRTLTLGGLSAHLAGAERLDFGARRGRRLLHGSATAAGRREVATRGVLDAADGPSIGASRPAAGSRARPAAFDLSRTSVPGRPGAGHTGGPEAATAARLQVMSASCWRRILHHRCRGEAQPAGGLVQRPRGGSEVRSRLHGGRGGTFGTKGGSPGRCGGP